MAAQTAGATESLVEISRVSDQQIKNIKDQSFLKLWNSFLESGGRGEIFELAYPPSLAASDYYKLFNGTIYAEVYLSSSCAEEPALYKSIETDQFAWWPIYINGGSHCGADMQKALAIGEWE